MFGDIANLITKTPDGTDDNNDPKFNETSVQIFCNRRSVRQTEFYQARSQGLKPEVVLEMRSIDYNGEEEAEFDGKRYDIIRTYEPNKDFIELVLGGIVNKS